GLLRVPADGVGHVVGPDAQREAEPVRVTVAVGDHDVARGERADVGTHLDDLADRGVARVHLAAAGLGDVDGVGRGGVVDVVLGGDREDLQLDVVRPEVAQLQVVELDHLGDVDGGDVAPVRLGLGSDRLGGDRVGL